MTANSAHGAERAVQVADSAGPGVLVFPLTPGAKTPARKGWQSELTEVKEDNADKILALFPEGSNYNIGCCLKDGFILDFDVKNGKRGLEFWEDIQALGLPVTRTVKTPSGGLHAYFLSSTKVPTSVGRVADGVDVRSGRDSYVVAPGSETAEGTYVISNKAPIARAPDWLVQMLLEATGPQPEKPGHKGEPPLIELDQPEAIARAMAYLLKDAPEAVEGDGGDIATFKIAARVKDLGVSERMAFDLLLDHWNFDKANPPWPAEDLRAKVRSAYKSGSSLIGCDSPAMAEIEFDAVEIGALGQREGQSATAQPRLSLLHWGDIEPSFDKSPDCLIEDWYDKHSLVVTYGESGSGKTHVVTSQAYAIATGRDWAGKKTQQGLVIYAALEGGSGFRKRVKAYKVRYPDARTVKFSLIAEPVNLRGKNGDLALLTKRVREAEEHWGEPAAMIVIDTLSRALAGGDENSSVDVGTFIENVDKLRAATGATIHIIHHSGKDAAKGQRGWSGMRAAIDTEIEVRKRAVKVTKQREQDDTLPALRFEYDVVELGRDASGKAVSSVVLRVGGELDFEVELSAKEREVLAAFSAAIAESGHGWCRNKDALRAYASAHGIQPTDPSGKNAFNYTTSALVEKGRLKKHGQGQHTQYVIAETVDG